MDPAVAWFQEEQNGPAKRLWISIWETIQEMDQQLQMATGGGGGTDNNNPPKTAKEMNMILDNNGSGGVGNNGSSGGGGGGTQSERTYYNPSRRKAAASALDNNRASTFNMNKYQARLVGKHGGCPWRPTHYDYGRGVIG